MEGIEWPAVLRSVLRFLQVLEIVIGAVRYIKGRLEGMGCDDREEERKVPV